MPRMVPGKTGRSKLSYYATVLLLIRAHFVLHEAMLVMHAAILSFAGFQGLLT